MATRIQLRMGIDWHVLLIKGHRYFFEKKTGWLWGFFSKKTGFQTKVALLPPLGMSVESLRSLGFEVSII